MKQWGLSLLGWFIYWALMDVAGAYHPLWEWQFWPLLFAGIVVMLANGVGKSG
jgi:hypothetical protein